MCSSSSPTLHLRSSFSAETRMETNNSTTPGNYNKPQTPHEYVCEEFSSVAFGQFKNFRDSEEMCDVVLCVKEAQIHAHRVVLAASSPYFKVMFTGKMVESTRKRISLRELDPQAVEQIVEFFYTGKIAIDEDNVQALLYASCLLQVNKIRVFCCNFLAQQISVANCLGIRALSDCLTCSELFETAQRFTIDNFSEVLQCEEFLMQPYESLRSLIECDNLSISGEGELLYGVLKWLHWDSAERECYAFPLLKRLHLMRADIRYLESILSNSLIKSNCDCMQLISETIQALSSPTVLAALEFPMFQCRKYGRCKEVLLAVGGESVGVTLSNAECFDQDSSQWGWTFCLEDSSIIPVPSMVQGRTYACISSTCHHVYTIGGSSSWKALDLVERYEWPDNQWKPCSPLNYERLGAGSAVLDGQLLVLGGCGKMGYMSSVESYDPLVDEWTVIEPLQTRRSYLGVAALNGYVYGVGGYGGITGEDDSWLSTAECFIPSGDVWIPVAPMLQPRAYFGLVAQGGTLYAIGGYNSLWTNTMERFDPREGQWYNSPHMKSPRSSLGVSVLGDSLYVAGGFDGVKNLNTVERYDIKAGKWTRVNPMRTVRYGMVLTTLQL